MAADQFVISVKGPNGACCPCASQVGCECRTIPCSLQCEAKGGSADMLGFPELTSPSSPPRFYLQRDIHGDMVYCQFASPGCAAAACPASVTFSGTIFITVATYTFSGSLTRISGPSGGFATYKATATVSPVDEVVIQLGSTTWHDGDTITIPVLTGDQGCNIQVRHPISRLFTNMQSKCLNMANGLSSIKDTWNLIQKINRVTGFPTFQNLSSRLTQLDGDCPPSGGVISELPIDASLSYGNSSYTLTQTKRVVTATGTCVNNVVAGTSEKYDGEVTEELTDEYTESDAIGKAEGAAVWGAALLGCGRTPTFKTLRVPGETIFGFRSVRVRVNFVHAIPSTAYKVRVHLAVRPLGSTIAYVPLRDADQSVTSDANGVGLSPWLLIDQLPGQEVVATGCEILISP